MGQLLEGETRLGHRVLKAVKSDSQFAAENSCQNSLTKMSPTHLIIIDHNCYMLECLLVVSVTNSVSPTFCNTSQDMT